MLIVVNMFLDLQKAIDDAIALFGDKNASGIVLLKSFNDYWNGYEDNNGKYHPGYVDLLEKLETEISRLISTTSTVKEDVKKRI